jgi:hypothetical protein
MSNHTSTDVCITDGFENKWIPAHEVRDWVEIGWEVDTAAAYRTVAQARERNAYRDRFPDVPDERDWPTREEDDALLLLEEPSR